MHTEVILFVMDAGWTGKQQVALALIEWNTCFVDV